MQAGKVMEAAARNEGAEFDWQSSRFDVEALQAAIMRLLERMRPPGAVERSRYAQYPTPADLGRTAAETALAIATLDKARVHELAAWRIAAPVNLPVLPGHRQNGNEDFFLHRPRPVDL
jgi:hypothetical protein